MTRDSSQQPPVFKGKVQDTGTTFAAPADQSLFASMRQAGIDWPVSCRNGTCRTCIGRLVEGQVAYDIPWPGLSLEEKRDGYCLPCIARPMGDIVIQRT
ncbi:2Fe-2S iron-sulfur cluster-binding protein [Malikia spinosa]|uniref:2Fe-2S iron-sulfur cluster binding domain-containing protein n=1 Tax=Malikia spinosa TaxID=86180 RepID=A0A7C9NB56_9BURK|nr:2Fe-2S iron-sulfur cluster binding domain-containing protein [Malikia spinosa]MYZ52465.1 2Fe-2S iron-sulfur cluster binding domain-containing protein [Malikia spinosa]